MCQASSVLSHVPIALWIFTRCVKCHACRPIVLAVSLFQAKQDGDVTSLCGSSSLRKGRWVRGPPTKSLLLPLSLGPHAYKPKDSIMLAFVRVVPY